MSLLGFDINATRARGVIGPAGHYPLPLPLDPPNAELALALSLEKKVPQVGQAGLQLARHSPHWVCQNFLPFIGQPSPRWESGRHRLDSAQALSLVWQRLAPALKSVTGVAVSLPGYLTAHQALLVKTLGQNQRVPLIGSLPTSMAAALAAAAEQWWMDAVLVIDVDDHALSLTLIQAQDGQASIVEDRHFPLLGLRIWKERLLNTLADRCVRQSRRDPRDAPTAEQSLYEQLESVMDSAQHGRFLHVAVQGGQWYQNLLVHPEDTLGGCLGLAQQSLREIECLYLLDYGQSIPVILLTAAAARLPGLAALTRQLAEDAFQGRRETTRQHLTTTEDFGEDLLKDSGEDIPALAILPGDGPVRAAHALAGLFQNGDLARGHLTTGVPLPSPMPLEAGPPRLQFQGQNYLLAEASFFLGSQQGCQMTFDSQLHPGVAPRHCEIVFDYRSYILVDRSREGTLVNDHPVIGSVVLRSGDWIKLGDRGPQVRFLGAIHGRPLVTTA